jgi:hypothetical protein
MINTCVLQEEENEGEGGGRQGGEEKGGKGKIDKDPHAAKKHKLIM